MGENNYGHPSEQTLQRLEEINAKIYRTDLLGEVKIFVNGKITVKCRI